jgi:hypothetical protein
MAVDVAKSAKERSTLWTPRNRSASERRSAFEMSWRPTAPRTGPKPMAGPANVLAWIFSTSDWRVIIETRTLTRILAPSDQATPCVSELVWISISSASGRSHDCENRPSVMNVSLNAPARARFGRNRVYDHNANPVHSPAMAPVRVAPGQYSPNTISGANWAAAANDNRPMDASAADWSVASR